MHRVPLKTFNWFLEVQTPCSMHAHGLLETLYVGKSKYQEIVVARLCNVGKALILDGKIQSSEYDEWIYHESLVHPVMLAHPNPTEVLILGGGEGATLREVLKHKSVKKVTMVDLDEEVIKVSKKYLPEWHRGSFDDPRAELVIEDGRKFLEEAPENSYDVVIIDLVDPTEGAPAAKLYTKEFYELVKKVLRDEGIMVTQATSTSYTLDVFTVVYRTVKEVFEKAGGYHSFVQAFDATWGFVWGSTGPDPSSLSPDAVDRLIRERLEGELKYYDGITHVGMFSLPKHVRKAMAAQTTVSTDERPYLALV
ncbi:spermine synthase [Ignicoccus hospitalis KIN4/I]|uniref:Polyamine aminopropyltransferase n=1 Tax=Ignicoccus hospitalis (strain KIN4/I / DSM 18386 / JCM 14125) TaxID=453591 RepID=A8AA63_IGNH4|nr:spermine synthase [Ignicoccus hospitalis KIN4/I]